VQRKFVIIFILFSCSICYAKTIAEAIDYSLKHNAEILLEKARLEKANSFKGEGYVGFLPDIRASYQRGRKKDDALGIERDNNLDKMSDQDIKSLNINQPIFQGFRNYYKFKEIRANINEADSYFQQRRNEILLSVVGSYLNLYKLRQISSLKKENIAFHEELLALVKQRNLLGELSNSEVIIYETKLFNILLKNMEIKKDLFKAEQEYQNIMGDIDFDLKLGKLDYASFPVNEEEFFANVVANNPDLQKFNHKIAAAISILKQNRGSFAPNIELAATVSEQDSVTYLDNRDLRTESLNLNISIPIFQKGSEYVNLSKAHKEVVFAKNEYNTNYYRLQKDIKQIYKEYNFYNDMITENKILLDFTQNRISVLDAQVKSGLGDVLDLLNAKIEFNSLQEQQLENKINYYINYYKILLYLNKLVK
jgi:protease secretion system outer membrane protein